MKKDKIALSNYLLCTLNCTSTVATVGLGAAPSDGTGCAARGLLRCAQRSLKPMLARARMDHKLVRITHQFMVALAPTNTHAHPSWQVRERMGRPPKGVGMPKRNKKKVDGPGQRRSSGGRPRKQPPKEGSGSERLDAGWRFEWSVARCAAEYQDAKIR